MTSDNYLNFINTALPVVDPQNPLYCPSISASAYLNSIFHRNSNLRRGSFGAAGNDYKIRKSSQLKGLKGGGGTKKALVSSFARMLAQMVLHSDNDRLGVKKANSEETEKKEKKCFGGDSSVAHCLDLESVDFPSIHNSTLFSADNKTAPTSPRMISLKSSPVTAVFSGPRLRAGARPVRKTRKDRAARIALQESNLKIHDLSPLAIPELSALPAIPPIPIYTPETETDSESGFNFKKSRTGGNATAISSDPFLASDNDVLVRLRDESSPHIQSISISLPEIPVLDISAIVAMSPLHSPSSSEGSDTVDRPSPTLPRRPPGVSRNLDVKNTDALRAEQYVDHLYLPSDGVQVEEKRHKSFKKRRMSEAFPDLLRKPAKFARSFVNCSLHKDDDILHQGEDLLLSPDLEPEDLKAIERGRRILHSPGPEPVSLFNKQGEDEVDLEEKKKRELEESLRGPSIGTETPRGYAHLVERLDGMMPGIRLGERLACLEEKPEGRHQAVVDFLAEEGLLNEQVMDLFRTSEVTRLSMSRSLAEEDGLNLGGRGVWDVFTRLNSFLFLTQLSFNNIPVMDFDLAKLGRLPRLTMLGLENTGVGDEGIFHLVSLKHTLAHLSLAYNPCVTDDAVPALILLEKLRYIGLVETSVTMVGLRKLARIIEQEGWVVDVEIPEVCERYVEGMSTAYLLHPLPPLITSPSLCSRLSAAALKRNLEAHKEVNPSIVAGGTREEMCERLRDLLAKREIDLVVWGMVYGDHERGHSEAK